MHLTWDRSLAAVVQVTLAVILVASHFITTSPFIYPHYVILILGHPTALRRVGIRIAPWQTVWIATTLFLHPMGGRFGLYGSVWWFDHLTHTLSATLVAAIGYTLVAAYARSADPPKWVVPAFTIVFVLAAGILWELIEAYTPILTVYGPNDTLWDHVFNFVGGAIVMLLGPRYLKDQAIGLGSWVEISRHVGSETAGTSE